MEKSVMKSLTDLTLVTRLAVLFEVSATKTIHADPIAP